MPSGSSPLKVKKSEVRQNRETMDDRIIELEKKAAFQEDLIEQLNQALIDQQKRIDLLEKRLKLIYGQIQSGVVINRPEEEAPPPHY